MKEVSRKIAIKSHQKSYEAPIKMFAGDHLQITKQDLWDGKYLWLWCIVSSGKEGWVPAKFIHKENDAGIAQYDYNAIELTITEGEELNLLEEESGWYWVENQLGEQGWVPTTCFRTES